MPVHGRSGQKMLTDNQASYEPDMAAAIDSEREILADRYGVSLAVAAAIIADRRATRYADVAHILGPIIGVLIAAQNPGVMVHALALAAGLDQLNGVHSEAEVARKLNVTRALLSHYVVAWRDLLSGREYSFDVTKFRKRNSTRATYAEKTKSPFLAAKAKAMAQLNKKRK